MPVALGGVKVAVILGGAMQVVSRVSGWQRRSPKKGRKVAVTNERANYVVIRGGGEGRGHYHQGLRAKEEVNKRGVEVGSHQRKGAKEAITARIGKEGGQQRRGQRRQSLRRKGEIGQSLLEVANKVIPG